MSKQCKGKYHGTAIKYINDDEKYCLICQQQIDLNKKKRRDTLAAIGAGVMTVVGIIGAIGKILGDGKGGRNNT